MSDILNKALTEMLTGQHQVAQKISNLSKRHGEFAEHTQELSEQTQELSEQTRKLSEQTARLSEQTARLSSDNQNLHSYYQDLTTESVKQADRIQAVIDALAQQADTSVETQIRLKDHEKRIQALEDRDAS